MPPPAQDRHSKIQAAAPPAGPSKILIGAVVAIVAIMAIVVGTLFANNRSETAKSAGGSAIPTGAAGRGVGIISVEKAAPSVPVLDIYEDFQCPICGDFEKQYGQEIRDLEASGTLKVRYNLLTFLDENLAGANDDAGTSGSSNRAANAATCAADAGAFQKYHDAVFAGQPAQEGKGYTDAQLTAFAQSAGLNGASLTGWQSCFTARSHNQYIESVQTQAAKDGVNGTPTLKVGDKIIDLRALAPGKIAALVKAAAS